MKEIHEYYDCIADISVSTREAIANLESATKKVQLAIEMIRSLKKGGGSMTISPVSIITENDVPRNLLFLELLLNQIHGVTNTSTFQELLELTNYSVNEEEF